MVFWQSALPGQAADSFGNKGLQLSPVGGGRLLRPLAAADQPGLRQALTVIDHHVDGYIAEVTGPGNF